MTSQGWGDGMDEYSALCSRVKAALGLVGQGLSWVSCDSMRWLCRRREPVVSGAGAGGKHGESGSGIANSRGRKRRAVVDEVAAIQSQKAHQIVLCLNISNFLSLIPRSAS